MDTPIKSFKRVPKPPATKLKIRKCVICCHDLVTAKKYYALKYKGPGHVKSMCERISTILNITEENIAGIAGHLCVTCKRKVDNVEKGSLPPDELRRLFSQSHGDQSQQSSEEGSSLIRKRMVKSPDKTSKRRHLDFSIGDGNAPPSQPHQSQLLKPVLEQIQEECRILCQLSFNSSFRRTDLNSFLNWSQGEQEQELMEHAPTLYAVLQAAAVNPRSEKRKPDTAGPKHGIPVVTAASILLHSRNQFMNAHQVMTGLVLKRGGAGKVTFNRLLSRSMSVGYRTIIKKQTEYGADFDKCVNEWKEEIENNVRAEKQEPVEASQPVSPKQQRAEQHPGFKLVGDNVDLHVKPRYSTIAEGNRDLHYYNVAAVKHRIPAPELDKDKPIGTVDSVPWTAYLPTADDNETLKAEWRYLVGRTIADYIPCFGWFKDYLPKHLGHQYSSLAKKKTEVISLGVILQNENTNEGMASILTETHRYVPAVDGVPEKMLSGGDLLTCERQLNAQEDRADSDDPVKRWGGLVPTIEDFHTYINFCEVIWGLLYSPLSAGDTGTLYHARNFLRAFNVSKDPFKNVNDCTDLLEKFTTVLTVTSALEFFGMDSLDSQPTRHVLDDNVDTDPKVYMEQTLNSLVEEFAIHDGPDMSEPVKLTCSHCSKEYKSPGGLRKHLKAKHPGHTGTSSSEFTSDQDSVYNYSCTALGLCLLAQDFADARKHGDGGRLIKLHKFLMLYFRLTGKSKYAYHCLHVLMQVSCLLSPRLAHHLTWNRFVNKSGGPDTNIEMDREMEYLNRAFKDECRGFRGKVTDASVLRVGRAAQQLDAVMGAHDSSYQIKAASGQHRKKDSTEDVLQLIQHVHKEHIFRPTDGRVHFAYPTISRNPLRQMNLPNLHAWMKKTTVDISRKQIYRA